jgi:hypothetical protein
MVALNDLFRPPASGAREPGRSLLAVQLTRVGDKVALWKVVAHRDFPIWILARKLIKRESLDENRVSWLLEAPGFVRLYPLSPRGVHSVEAADEADQEEVAA